MAVTLGIDVAKHDFHAAIQPPGRERWHERRFPNTAAGVQACHRWLESLGLTEAVVALEATGIYSEPLAERFYALGYGVHLLNPAQVIHHARSELQRAKTDRIDARSVSEVAQAKTLPFWAPASATMHELRELHRHLRGLRHSRAQLYNRLETQGETTRASLQRLLEAYDAEIRETRERLQTLIRACDELNDAAQRLASIPAVGETLIAELLVRLPKIQCCRRAQSLVAFAGLDPRPYESGTSVRAPRRISKCGDAALRKALYFPTLCAMKHNPVIRAYVERLKQRGVRGKSLVCAAARKLLHLIHGVLKSGKSFDPNIPLQAQG